VPAAVVNALAEHDYAQALAVADKALLSASPSPWLDYDRAEALAGLGRTDEAVEAFRKAEQRFRTAPEDRAGESAAKWGRARALAEAGRCSEARGAYDEYAAFVAAFDPPAANLAATRALECRSVVRLP
jgi:Flp pilus assembly protein TadD